MSSQILIFSEIFFSVNLQLHFVPFRRFHGSFGQKKSALPAFAVWSDYQLKAGRAYGRIGAVLRVLSAPVCNLVCSPHSSLVGGFTGLVECISTFR